MGWKTKRHGLSVTTATTSEITPMILATAHQVLDQGAKRGHAVHEDGLLSGWLAWV